MTINSRPVEILLVEDDLGDSDLIQEVFEESQFSVTINLVRDGDSAIAYLRQEGEYANATLPDLILLDLNLPPLGGQEVLKAIKSDNYLKHIPVIILTTSDSREDILRSYQLGANSYISKPLGLEEFVEVIRLIEDYWFNIVKLPNQRNQ
ncbi:MAG: response regulator [Coleofasciculus sp. Co-bin14]|nr:response regulator [Coleofasciculus sp. Co-bin14]